MDAPPPSKNLPVNEIRDYHRINAELAQLLDRGATHVRLTGVEGQRLLLSCLRGRWQATIDIDGRAGPELAAELDAPGLTILAHSGASDGAGRGLRSGCLILLGETDNLAAYRQTGGTVLCLSPTGHRPGLELRGGSLLIASTCGRLLGERQCGGRIFVGSPSTPFAVAPGHARRGGRLLLNLADWSRDDQQVFDDLRLRLARCLGSTLSEQALSRFLDNSTPAPSAHTTGSPFSADEARP